MPAFAKLVVVEAKLFRRDVLSVFFGLLFPALLLLFLGGVFPGFREPDPEAGGLRMVDVYVPVMLVFTLTITGVSALPAALATARERGVLRRLWTTPVHPSRYLLAQLTVHLMTAVLGSALAIVAVALAFDIDPPQHAPGFVLAFVLAAAALFSLGLLVGAVVPGTSASHAVGTLVWLPLMVLAGLWFPREVMPEAMRRVSDLSPGGAGVQAMQDAWFGSAPAATNLTVLAAFALATALAAAKLFRWE